MATRTPNRSCPAQETTDLLEVVNSIADAIAALLAKLDLDEGVTDDDYADTIGAIDTISPA